MNHTQKILESFQLQAVTIGQASNALWETFATIDGEELPQDVIDAMQVALVRWQRRNFGDVSPVDKVDIHMSLGIVEEFGEALGTEVIHGDKGKLDGLGDICVYAGQLLNSNRLAIRPIMHLADIIADSFDDEDRTPDPAVLLGLFAHTVLKHDQKIRGFDKLEVWRPALVLHVATIIAYAKADIGWVVSEAIDKLKEAGEEVPTDADLIQRTYIQVGGGVVLKRNWTKDKLAGQTPA